MKGQRLNPPQGYMMLVCGILNYQEAFIAKIFGIYWGCMQKKGVVFQVHNYFPPPKSPFVLNLGSSNPDIAYMSIEHVKSTLALCNYLGASRYSFHAGFLIDPRVDELGSEIEKRKMENRSDCIDRFLSRVHLLAAVAANYGVELMIENNVLSSKNYERYKGNPLLMCDPIESQLILNELPKDVGILVDVAHLKVSSKTLGFDPADYFKKVNERVAGYHLSDNDGYEDTNNLFDKDAWFWKHLNPKIDYVTIEVYRVSESKLADISLFTKSMMKSLLKEKNVEY